MKILQMNLTYKMTKYIIGYVYIYILERKITKTSKKISKTSRERSKHTTLKNLTTYFRLMKALFERKIQFNEKIFKLDV